MFIKFNTPVVLFKIFLFSLLIIFRGTRGSCWRKLIYTIFLPRVYIFQSLLTQIMRNRYKSQNVKSVHFFPNGKHWLFKRKKKKLRYYNSLCPINRYTVHLGIKISLEIGVRQEEKSKSSLGRDGKEKGCKTLCQRSCQSTVFQSFFYLYFFLSLGLLYRATQQRL